MTTTVADPPCAARMADISPFHVMEILARARTLEAQGRDIVHMEIGEPDFVTPQTVIAAGQAALADGHTHYTPAAGLWALREAISKHYRQRFGVEVAAERILITPGASGALQLIMGVLVDPGERVLMTDPGYPCNRHMVRLFGGEAVGLPVDAAQDYAPTQDQVEAHWDEHTRLLMLASPSNPTGSVIGRSAMQTLYNQLRRRDGLLLVDEIYQGLMYGAEAETALSLGEEGLFVVNSFSKYFGMTGWRLGWLVAPSAYVPLLDRLAQNIFLAAPTPAQYAALAAFEPETLAILEQRREVFRQRRDLLYEGLCDMGFGIPALPQGAFYLYADSSAFGDDSFELARRLLEEAGVAVTPGLDFGSNAPERHIRFAYTTGADRLEEGLRRLRGYLQG